MQVLGFHRFLASRFPYAAYYKVDGDICIGFRVLDSRQEPAKTTKALTKEKWSENAADLQYDLELRH